MLQKVWYWVKRVLARILAFMLLWVRFCLKLLTFIFVAPRLKSLLTTVVRKGWR